MPRPRKTVAAENTAVLEVSEEPIKPFNQTIQAPMIDASLAELTLSGDFDIIPKKSPLMEDLEDVEDLVEEEYSPRLQYDVYSNEVLVETVDDESERLLFYLGENKAQLQSWVDELSLATNNEEDLALFNTPDNGFVYKSLRQYFSQNGLAPVAPKVTDWMQYYLRKHNPITKEEIAILVKGNLKYSFVPKNM
jgi:hypothetical protein